MDNGRQNSIPTTQLIQFSSIDIEHGSTKTKSILSKLAEQARTQGTCKVIRCMPQVLGKSARRRREQAKEVVVRTRVCMPAANSKAPAMFKATPATRTRKAVVAVTVLSQRKLVPAKLAPKKLRR